MALTLTNRFAGSNGLGGGDVNAFPVGNITNNTISTSPLAFRPVTLVVNGFGNSAGTANQAYTGGTVFNGSRFEPTTPNALGLGPVTIREGGSVLFNVNAGVSNNMSLKGLGINEGGTFGALRLGGGGNSPGATGNISLDSAITRIQVTDTGHIFGNVTGTMFSSARAVGRSSSAARSPTRAPRTWGWTDGNAHGHPHGLHSGQWRCAILPGASSSAASNLLWHSGTLNYIGRRRLHGPALHGDALHGHGSHGLTIANNGYGNLDFTNPGAIVMANGSADVTLTLTANNYTQNTFTPSLSDPAGPTESYCQWWHRTGNVDIEWLRLQHRRNGCNCQRRAADPGHAQRPDDSGADREAQSYLVKNNTNTLTLGGIQAAGRSGQRLRPVDGQRGTVISTSGAALGFKPAPSTAGAMAGASPPAVRWVPAAPMAAMAW